MATENTETEVVRTELPREEYERLRKVAERNGTSLEAALREAAREYTGSHDRSGSRDGFDPTDPFFAADPPDSTGDSYDAGAVDDRLYE